ncbi:hypothetical protein [Halomicrobium katesii]|nr:hypothetical protein [Halomicrobium katesii]
MRRPSTGRDRTDGLDATSDTTAGDVPRREDGDWAARHGRTRRT